MIKKNFENKVETIDLNYSKNSSNHDANRKDKNLDGVKIKNCFYLDS